MTLTNANLYTGSYNSIKNFIYSIPGIDPRNRLKQNWIHASLPYVSDIGFEGYPFIVLQVRIEEDEETFDSNIGQKTFRVNLIIYSDQPTQVDSMADAIRNHFSNNTLTDFQRVRFSNSPISYDIDLNGKKIIFRNMGIIFRSYI